MSFLKSEIEALKLEVEHSSSVVKLLQNKVDKERSSLYGIDKQVEDEFQHTYQDSIESYQTKINEFSAVLNESMVEKQQLIEECKNLVDSITSIEKETSECVRKVHKDYESSAEHEKKSFKLGYEERLQKVW
jgi:predicted  nucleic acid-binding Zn-ribbon protein